MALYCQLSMEDLKSIAENAPSPALVVAAPVDVPNDDEAVKIAKRAIRETIWPLIEQKIVVFGK